MVVVEAAPYHRLTDSLFRRAALAPTVPEPGTAVVISSVGVSVRVSVAVVGAVEVTVGVATATVLLLA